MSKGTLRFTETFCASCTYAIERTGRKIKGIDDVFIDARTGVITVDYNGDHKALERLREIADTLGHGAEIVSYASEEE